MYRLYVVVSCLAVPLAALALFWKGIRNRAYWERFPERFGFGDRRPEGGCIWVHAVSVGEVVASSALVESLLRDHPDVPLAVTTVTPAGAQQARDQFGDRVLHSYAPYDSLGSVRRFLRRMQPRLVIVMETELWPNLFAECRAREVPLVLANARISPRSIGHYRRFARLFRQVFGGGVFVAAQSEEDADNFRLIGADPASVFVTGNLKADLEFPTERLEAGHAFRKKYAADRPIWVAASTHEGEEAMVLEAHDAVCLAMPDALLFLVPRHPERFAAVAELMCRRHTAFGRRSAGQTPTSDQHVYLVDTLGELPLFYAASDVAFVGGSLVPIGGHNVLEPAVLSMPVLAGPHNFNSKGVTGVLQEAGGLEIVADAASLGSAVSALLLDPALRLKRGICARRGAAATSGALSKLLDLLAPLLHRDDIKPCR